MEQNTYDEETTQTTVSNDLIDLGVGHPGLPLLPLELIHVSAQRQFDRSDSRILQYGYEQGTRTFREALAGFLERATGTTVDARQLFVSGGVSQALDLLCSLFTQPGDLVLVEEPTYFLALRIFEDHGLRVKSVAIDEEGLDPRELETAISEEIPAFIYTIPVHQNPSGATLSEARRTRLVDLAQRAGFFVVADEVYQLLTYDGSPPQPFAEFVEGGHVCALGSFSKILAPGLRMGWINAGEEIIKRIVESGFLDSGGGLAPFTSALLTDAVENGELESHIERLRQAYRARRDAALSVLQSAEAERKQLRASAPKGGYFVWAELTDGRSAQELLGAAQKAGVGFVPGPRFSPTGRLSHCFRISFSYYDPEHVAEGARRLLTAL
ncbi:MAG: PLP-dependent aminotransferase family protein [Spirochaetia bacterium]